MSDPRLTAAHVALILSALDDQDYGEDPSINDCRDLCRSHEQLRADVERLTAEHAALKTSDSQRVILEMLLSAIDTVLLGNEVSDFEESFPPVRQVIDLKDERDHLRAEHAALREERDQAFAEIRRLRNHPIMRQCGEYLAPDAYPLPVPPAVIGHGMRICEYSTFGKLNFVLDNEVCRLSAENAALREALEKLVGASTREELEGMESALRAMPIPAEDKAATIDAIHALLEVKR